jgi:mannose-6-phosphate isomerase-like protein (cupin superfamily)
MHTRHPDDIAPVEKPDGTRVRELAGNFVGGLSQHSVAHITLPPGKSAHRHYHPSMEESYILLAGTAQVEVGEETHTARVGEIIAIPPHLSHTIINRGADDVVFLAICSPAWTPDCSVFE